LSFGCPDGPTFSTTTTYSFPSNRPDGILFFAIGGTQELWYLFIVVNNNVSNSKSGPCCTAARFTYSSCSSLNLPTLLDPKGRTMNGESIMSASQIMVKQQGLKQQNQTIHGADHEMVKLWCIGMEVVGISML
jgi:hypothetical protein